MTTKAAPKRSWIALSITGDIPVQHTLPVGESFRRALMARTRLQVPSDDDMPVQLVARRRGVPASGHSHLTILPCDLDRDGLLDTVLLTVQGGFHEAVQAGILDLSVVHITRKASVEPHPRDLPGDLFQPATSFASTTPFVCPRFPKLRGGAPRRDPEGEWAHGPEHQLRYLLEQAGLPAPASLRAADVRFGVWVSGRLIPWHDFTLERRHGGGKRGLAHGFGFHLNLPCPIRGPFASGYASHFGLGQFHPV